MHPHPVPLKEHVEGLAGHVFHVAVVLNVRLLSGSLPIHDPAQMCPPESLIGRVGVQGGVCLEVVETVVAHPFDGRSLACLASQERKKVFQELGCLEGAVAELSVVGRGTADAQEEEADRFCHEQPPPGEKEGRNEDEDQVVEDDVEVPQLHTIAKLLGV